MHKNKRSSIVLPLLLIAVMVLLQACGGGGSSSTSLTDNSTSSDSGSSTIAGIALPTEVSAVSTETSASDTSASLASSVRSLARAASTLPADTDYMKTKPAKFVDEPVLEVFGIIETILKAAAQTNYADAENVGAGPYKAIVAWYEDRDGQATKELEEWVVESEMVDGVNQVRVWINDPEEPVKVSMEISTAPTQDNEGNYVDYGEWSISANVDGGIFFADAQVTDSGATQLRLSEDFTFSETIDDSSAPIDITEKTKAILVKSPTSGYGKARVANFEYCWDYDFQTETSPCADPNFNGILPQTNVQYAYNTDTLVLEVDEDGDSATTDDIETAYKDRTNPAVINYRYGLFDAETGQNVEKIKQFGFPVTYDDGTTIQHGYYGSWQGRHQLWLGMNENLTSGLTVTEEVWDNSTPRTFTTAVYDGTLTKRTLVPGQLSQIQDIPVEIWLSDHYDLRFDDTVGGWVKCSYEVQGVDQNGNEIWQENCSETAFDMTQLVFSNDSRKNVNIDGQICESYSDMGPMGCTSAQFEVAQDGTVNYMNSGVPLMPKHGDMLWVNVEGSTYIVYNGNTWREKILTDFDEQTWTPVFAVEDLPFDFPTGREYYINNKGTNFVVKRSSNGYEVDMEVQTVVRPDNYASVLGSIDHFAYEWEDANSRSTFVFNPTTMMLEYDTVGSNDSSSGAVTGDTVTKGNWGLVAFDADDNKIMAGNRPLQFNWEYASQGDGWGKVTYLVDSSGYYVLLDDPVLLDPIDLDGQTYSLQFDGWMHGLPDMHWELQKNDYILDDSIRNKIVNVPTGMLVTDSSAAPAKSYYVKPLEIGVVLPVLDTAPAGAPSPDDADALDIDFSVPTPSDIGEIPTDVETKYVEGKSV